MPTPANLTTNKNAIRESVKELLGFILSNSTLIQMTLDHFPSPDEKIEFPAVTVAAKTPKFSPVMPYVIGKTDSVDISLLDPEDPESGVDPDNPNIVSTVTRVVGAYDFKFQLDVWTAYKPQRDSMVEEVIKIFNLNTDVPGISLQLSDYFDEWCHFTIDAIQYMEDEASSQRGEWRAMLTVFANVRCVMEKVEHIFETIENTLETPPTIAAPEQDEGELII